MRRSEGYSVSGYPRHQGGFAAIDVTEMLTRVAALAVALWEQVWRIGP
jgi:hypothetical protein